MENSYTSKKDAVSRSQKQLHFANETFLTRKQIGHSVSSLPVVDTRSHCFGASLFSDISLKTLASSHCAADCDVVLITRQRTGR
jgi:hypothetical protein